MIGYYLDMSYETLLLFQLILVYLLWVNSTDANFFLLNFLE